MGRVAPRYLVDKSAYARMRTPEVRAILAPLIEAGEVAICGMITLEILYSARSLTDLEAVRSELRAALTNIPLEERDFDRAIEVIAALAIQGQHRAAKLPDLLIAAVAERANLTVLHYDEDFERIATVTGQPMQWVVLRGSVK
jgi:predicted nucleic acid-binding protein